MEKDLDLKDYLAEELELVRKGVEVSAQHPEQELLLRLPKAREREREEDPVKPLEPGLTQQEVLVDLELEGRGLEVVDQEVWGLGQQQL
jgi:hypothetical protein